MKVGRMHYPLTDDEMQEINDFLAANSAKHYTQRELFPRHGEHDIDDRVYFLHYLNENVEHDFDYFKHEPFAEEEVDAVWRRAIDALPPTGYGCRIDAFVHASRKAWDMARKVNAYYAAYMETELIYSTWDHSGMYNVAVKFLYYKRIAMGDTPDVAYKYALKNYKNLKWE